MVKMPMRSGRTTVCPMRQVARTATLSVSKYRSSDVATFRLPTAPATARCGHLLANAFWHCHIHDDGKLSSIAGVAGAGR
jgi:hypothetical protein